jgi:hypothetical protein
MSSDRRRTVRYQCNFIEAPVITVSKPDPKSIPSERKRMLGLSIRLGDFTIYEVVNDIERRLIHSNILTTDSTSSCPLLVNVYSTLGGISL